MSVYSQAELDLGGWIAASGSIKGHPLRARNYEFTISGVAVFTLPDLGQMPTQLGFVFRVWNSASSTAPVLLADEYGNQIGSPAISVAAGDNARIYCLEEVTYGVDPGSGGISPVWSILTKTTGARSRWL